MHKKRSWIILVFGIAAIAILNVSLAFAATQDNHLNQEEIETINCDVQKLDDITFEAVCEIANVKENIYNNMINSVDFYDAVKGSFTTTFIRSGENVTVDYQVDIPSQIAYESIKGCYEDAQLIYMNDTMHIYDGNNQRYSEECFISQFEAKSRPVELDSNICIPHGAKPAFFDGEKYIYDRVVICEDGERGYYYRPDITNTSIANMSIFPQSLGMALLTDLENWDIVDVEQYLGRSAIVVSGIITDKSYSDRISSDTFTARIDIQTGVLLDFKGYSSKGELTQSISTSSIEFLDSNDCNGIKEFIQENLRLMLEKNGEK